MTKKNTFSFPEEDLQLFPKPHKIKHVLQELVESPLSGLEFLRLWPKLRSYFETSSDPQRLLVHLLRVSNRMFNPATFFIQLNQYEHFRTILFTIMESSAYLTDILTRHPEYFYWLCTKGINISHGDREAYGEELNWIFSKVFKTTRIAELVKAFKRREILRIAVRDLLQMASFQETVSELSALAEVILCTVLQYQQSQFEKQIGTPNTTFCILAMGKLGGHELNYSSDIDLIFFYGQEGEIDPVDDVHKQSHHQYFNLLSEELTRFLSAIQHGECVYRVDTKLRPDGESGPLARSFNSMIRYYETRGKMWERQMLIKAQSIAGDLQLGDRLLNQLIPFIYPRTFFTSPMQEITRMKKEIESKMTERGEEYSNVKLMTGGIRDVEFITQAFQLLNGGKEQELRAKSTLKALELLEAKRILSHEESINIRDAYIFFRRVEHFQQLASGRQKHLLPSEYERQIRTARFLGYSDWGQFLKSFQKKQKTVRFYFDDIFSISSSDSRQLQYKNFSDDKPPEHPLQKLRQAGFRNPEQIYRGFKKLAETVLFHSFDQSKDFFDHFLQQLLSQVKTLPDPDQAINRLFQLIQAYGSQERYIQMLIQQPAFLKLILDICVKAPALVRMIQLEPKYFSMLFSAERTFQLIFEQYSPRHFVSQYKDIPLNGFLKRMIADKNQTWLIIGIQFLKGDFTSSETWWRLSQLADWTLNVLVMRLCQEEQFSGLCDQHSFGLFALGKYGGCELNFGSDLDIIFLYSGEQIFDSTRQTFTHFVQHLVQLNTRVTPLGFLYRIDLRLRPEGGNAPLAFSDRQYFEYLAKRSQLWERQALLKIRWVAGDPKFGKKVINNVQNWIFQNFRLDKQEIDEMITMRYRIESEKGRLAKRTNIKTDKGGLVDIEFLSQMAGLIWQEESKKELPLSTLTGIRLLNRKHIISKKEFEFIQNHYCYLRDLETYINLTLQKTKPEIPSDESSQKLLSYCFAHKDKNSWFKNLEDQMETMREVFIACSERLKKTIME